MCLRIRAHTPARDRNRATSSFLSYAIDNDEIRIPNDQEGEMQTGSAGLQSAEATCPLCRGQAGYVRSPLLVRSVCKNESPCVASHSSRFFVQSQSQQAHGSVPFSCRQLRRECASFTLSNSKY